MAVELALILALAALLEGDLWRQWQDCLVATDAAGSYGFGVSVAKVLPSFTRATAQCCATPLAFIRLDRSTPHEHQEEERPREGTPCVLPLGRGAFRPVLSSKARFKAHSGSLEATGVELGLQWILRSSARHGRRTLLLIDARAVLGAVAKGRSSARTIRRNLMRIAALVLAGDLLVHVAYIPSEDNPADTPSRGVREKWRRHRQGIAPVKKPHLKRTLSPIAHSCQHRSDSVRVMLNKLARDTLK